MYVANRKDLIIAVLVTFCLAVTLFAVIPIKSSSSSNAYDPWLDLNDDGVIDPTDLGMLGTSWSTTGDPTKNVNITNWPSVWPSGNVNVTNWPEDRPLTAKKGIEKITIIDFYGGGDGTGHGVVLGTNVQIGKAQFAFCFEPKGQLINVTDMYVSYVWHCDNAGTHRVDLELSDWLGRHLNPIDLDQGLGKPLINEPEADCLRVRQKYSDFNFTYLQAGMMLLELVRSDITGTWIYFHNLDLYIEYYYWS
jgi:hypothetical protein